MSTFRDFKQAAYSNIGLLPWSEIGQGKNQVLTQVKSKNVSANTKKEK